MQKKWSISNEFGLSGPVIQKKDRQKKNLYTSTYRSMRQVQIEMTVARKQWVSDTYTLPACKETNR